MTQIVLERSQGVTLSVVTQHVTAGFASMLDIQHIHRPNQVIWHQTNTDPRGLDVRITGEITAEITMKPIPDKLWIIDDVADYLSVKESVVRYWVRNREIPFVRLGRQTRFVPQDIIEWIAAKSNVTRFVDARELRRV